MEATVQCLNKEKTEKIINPGMLVWLRLKRNRLAMAGLYVLLLLVLISIIGPFISPYKMETIDLYNIDAKPSLSHPLGTDQVGRDLLTRLIYAGRISLSVGISAVVVSVIIGGILGAIAGFYGGRVDAVIMRAVDIFLCFPSLPLLLMLGAIMSDIKMPPQFRLYTIMFIIGFLSWPGLCRLVRGQILSLRELEFMQAADALGIKDRKKIFRHLLPNTLPTIIVSATLGIGGAILSESGLSYLGLGITPPTPSWGQMIQSVNDMFSLQFQPWKWMPAGFCIFLTVMAVNVLGDGLRDALDPKLKR